MIKNDGVYARPLGRVKQNDDAREAYRSGGKNDGILARPMGRVRKTE